MLAWPTVALLLLTAGLGLYLPALGLLIGVPPLPDNAPVVGRLEPSASNTEHLVAGGGVLRRVGAIGHLSLTGDPAELGAAHGALMAEAVGALEGDLVATLIDLVPTFAARHLLLGVVGFNNRHLHRHFHDHELHEILAMTRAPDPIRDPWRALGPPYQRALHYHALHDISQYLIDNPLVRPIQVGCSAFAAGRERGIDGRLIVGRLFDFEGGPRFDLDKIVISVRPDRGLRFVHVAWPGMSGAVTGFNEAGLWASINAADTRGMGFSGRPIVMALREVLQFATDIESAVAILARSQVFVSDGVLLASRDEDRAVLVELGPSGWALRDWQDGLLLSTNHFLHPHWAEDRANQLRIERSTTAIRKARLAELLATGVVDPGRAAAVLRDRRGPGNVDLGFNNRGTINAWIGAHLAVADLHRGLIWVAEPRHGLGILRAFDLDGAVPAEDLPADPELTRCLESLPPWLQLRAEALRLFPAARRDAPGARARLHELGERMSALNPGSFANHWALGLAKGSQGASQLHRALELRPPYAEDRERIAADLAAIRP